MMTGPGSHPGDASSRGSAWLWRRRMATSGPKSQLAIKAWVLGARAHGVLTNIGALIYGTPQTPATLSGHHSPTDYYWLTRSSMQMLSLVFESLNAAMLPMVSVDILLRLIVARVRIVSRGLQDELLMPVVSPQTTTPNYTTTRHNRSTAHSKNSRDQGQSDGRDCHVEPVAPPERVLAVLIQVATAMTPSLPLEKSEYTGVVDLLACLHSPLDGLFFLFAKRMTSELSQAISPPLTPFREKLFATLRI
ncbi:hypothetical protein Q5P01_000059 [Channa striata]|uniref:Uncharacterized protein n=1 Tax=Channa striata TaxID=64152 RepID=A0AA88IHV9_CHASR|nr:hypothetical protein Q5P01_000059 [Channa striata]